MSRTRQKTMSKRVAEVAIKGMELGVENADFYAATTNGRREIEVDAQFMRDFAMAYLATMRAQPEIDGWDIRYIVTNENGIDCEARGIFRWSGPGVRKTPRVHFQELYDIYRHYEHAGPVRKPSDIEGRPIAACALALLKAKLGPKWFDILQSRMSELHKRTQNPFKSGYRTLTEGLKIKLSGHEILVDVAFGKVTYKNSTMNLKGMDLPESVKHTIVGRSLKDIAAGLPEDHCFAKTIANDVERPGESFVVKFTEERVPLKAA